MSVKLKTDENIPGSVAELLRERGYDVTTALEEGLKGALDPQVAAVCRSEQRALVTLDRGLGDIRTYPPADYYGIVVLRSRDQSVDALLSLVSSLLRLLETEPLAGALWIIDEGRARIRR